MCFWLIAPTDLFESEIAEAPPPRLFFKDPKELMRVFGSMELQNLNALIHLESLAGPMAEMALSVIETETLMKQELGEIEEGLGDVKVCAGLSSFILLPPLSFQLFFFFFFSFHFMQAGKYRRGRGEGDVFGKIREPSSSRCISSSRVLRARAPSASFHRGYL